MHRAIKVRKGQRYEEVVKVLGSKDRVNIRGRPTVWEVRSVSVRFLAAPHAWLVNQEDPSAFKLVSCKALADGRCFKLVSAPDRQRAIEPEAA